METQSQTQNVSELSHQQRFFHYFQHEITGEPRTSSRGKRPVIDGHLLLALQEQMDRLAETALVGGERSDAADHCLAGITRLSSEVKDASGYLPAYDQRTYAEVLTMGITTRAAHIQQAIKALQEKLEETRRAFAPKPKFSFKSAHKSPSALSLSDAAELAAEKRRTVPGYLSPTSSSNPSYINTPQNEKSAGPDEEPASEIRVGSRKESDSTTTTTHPTTTKPRITDSSRARTSLPTAVTSISINNQSNTHIILPSSALNSQTPCSLQNLTRCVIDLSVPTTETAPFASLTMSSISSSLLLCGSVSGPAHITAVRSSVLVIKCRQFRMHECENVDVYLHCISRPIIEDCKGIRFAVLPKFHSELISSSQEKPDTAPNQWNQIDDFKWLKAEPSPNWSILPIEESIPDETWREIVPSGPGWDISDILMAVGLGRTA
ncbi:uncharacterized protein Z518_09842 [Rhinocladiella mackenziei CBS 650.93]|uniref:C-CAP/cofactor C-like domain-containing protein n=1 Tax=Rhinocladiella mackenziei CBS 650.93 TaxID=1442369 RepID=A0A0D2FFI2_9EURO|nr:uncharacterized protein Z518_09842 [Rhinocladiella mackenziei CBS 650.93]KIX00777.1 hypothetical protein Z518_09842 [Rhinocladiella mackenziei CBS 650.93]